MAHRAWVFQTTIFRSCERALRTLGVQSCRISSPVEHGLDCHNRSIMYSPQTGLGLATRVWWVPNAVVPFVGYSRSLRAYKPDFNARANHIDLPPHRPVDRSPFGTSPGRLQRASEGRARQPPHRLPGPEPHRAFHGPAQRGHPHRPAACGPARHLRRPARRCDHRAASPGHRHRHALARPLRAGGDELRSSAPYQVEADVAGLGALRLRRAVPSRQCGEAKPVQRAVSTRDELLQPGADPGAQQRRCRRHRHPGERALFAAVRHRGRDRRPGQPEFRRAHPDLVRADDEPESGGFQERLP